jgi:hypothetical protein
MSFGDSHIPDILSWWQVLFPDINVLSPIVPDIHETSANLIPIHSLLEIFLFPDICPAGNSPAPRLYVLLAIVLLSDINDQPAIALFPDINVLSAIVVFPDIISGRLVLFPEIISRQI